MRARMKIKKSFSKRFKVTKRGKIVRRSMGIDHFRTRKSKKSLRNKKKNIGIDYPARKLLNY